MRVTWLLTVLFVFTGCGILNDKPLAINKTPNAVQPTSMSTNPSTLVTAVIRAVASEDSTPTVSAQPTNVPVPTLVSPSNLLRLLIPKIGLEETAYEITQEKLRTDDPLAVPLNQVVHVADSFYPGQNGNILFLGHVTTNFKRLTELSPGDEISVDRDGIIFSYIVEKTFTVTKDDPDGEGMRYYLGRTGINWPDGRSYNGEWVTLVTSAGEYKYSGKTIVGSTANFFVIAKPKVAK